MKLTILLLAASAFGQDQAPAFRSMTRLVEASVSVTDAAGRPVAGLRREDFTVKAGGRLRQVAFLQSDSEASGHRQAAPLPKFVYTNRPEFQKPAARNVIAVVIDTLNTTVPDGVRLQTQLLKWLRQMPSGQRVALYQLSGNGLRTLHDFTADPEELGQRIARMAVGRLPGAEEDAASLKADAQALADVLGAGAPQWQETMDRLLAAEREQAGRMKTDRLEAALLGMKALASHLAAVPGRKNLVWAGGGLPLLQVVGNITAHDPHRRYIFFEQQIESAARRLAAANVVLYYFDTRGLVAPSHAASGRSPQITSDAQRITEDARIGTTLLAHQTGGRYLGTSNSVETAFEAAQADLKASYTLAFYADEEAGREWVPMAIEVKRPGVRVRHREGYSLTLTAAPNGQDAAQEALRRPLGSDGILMNARCEPDSAAGPSSVRLFVQIDAESLPMPEEAGRRSGTLEVTVAEVTAAGRTYTHTETARVNVAAGEWARVLKEGIPYVRQWTPKLEAERLRILVRWPETGQAGTLDIALKSVFR
jgi:VWFA-related protein